MTLLREQLREAQRRAESPGFRLLLLRNFKFHSRNHASHFRIDDAIDPAATRKWIAAGLRSSPKPRPRTGKSILTSIVGAKGGAVTKQLPRASP